MFRTLLPLLAILAACHTEEVAVVNGGTTSDRPAVIVPDPAPVEVAPSAPLDPGPAVVATAAVDPVEIRYAVFKLGRGETLDNYAKWSGIPVETIAESSALRLDDVHAVGTTVRIPVDADGETRIAARRDAWEQARVDRWVATRHGEVTTGVHTVHTGETAWTLGHGKDAVPAWVLASYNPGVDLDHLKPGQELSIPVVNVPAVAEQVAPVETDGAPVVAQGAATDSDGAVVPK